MTLPLRQTPRLPQGFSKVYGDKRVTLRGQNSGVAAVLQRLFSGFVQGFYRYSASRLHQNTRIKLEIERYRTAIRLAFDCYIHGGITAVIRRCWDPDITVALQGYQGSGIARALQGDYKGVPTHTLPIRQGKVTASMAG